MSVIKAIYNAPVVEHIFDGKFTQLYVKYNGQLYYGLSVCHDEDVDFTSAKVGYNIALSRARIQILEHEYAEAQQTFMKKYQFYQEVLGYGSKPPAEVDPTGAFYKNVSRAMTRVETLKEILTREKKYLADYLEGQAKALDTIKRFRSKGNNS